LFFGIAADALFVRQIGRQFGLESFEPVYLRSLLFQLLAQIRN
jgi:hypothetical protein